MVHALFRLRQFGARLRKRVVQRAREEGGIVFTVLSVFTSAGEAIFLRVGALELRERFNDVFRVCGDRPRLKDQLGWVSDGPQPKSTSMKVVEVFTSALCVSLFGPSML